MGTEFFTAIGVFPAELSACQAFNVLHFKLAKIKFRATLNFQKFKVAMNATYRIFQTLPKVAPNHAYQMLMI